MDHLLAGYRRFRENQWERQRQRFEALAAGQNPRALVVACIDSRVDPAVIFDAAPGELLTVRNVANLVPPYAPDAARHGTSAALEFGVRVLAVPRIIVLGHSGCGGVDALLHGAPAAGDFVPPWMEIAAPARERARAGGPGPDDVRTRCEQEVIRIALANLLTFPWIADRVRSGELKLDGAWFAIRTGTLALLGPGGAFTAAV